MAAGGLQMCDSVRRSSHSGRGFADVAECFQVFAFPPEKCEVFAGFVLRVCGLVHRSTCTVHGSSPLRPATLIHTEELRPVGPLRVGVETFFLKTAPTLSQPVFPRSSLELWLQRKSVRCHRCEVHCSSNVRELSVTNCRIMSQVGRFAPISDH